MLNVLRQRLLLSIPLLIFVTLITFFMVSLTPGDPAVVILGQNRPVEEYQRLREQLGLLEEEFGDAWARAEAEGAATDIPGQHEQEGVR